MTDEEKQATALAAVPKNYSKQETVDRWVAENGDQAFRKLALDKWRCEVLAISVAVNNSPVEVFLNGDGKSEADMLKLFSAYLDEAVKDRHRTFAHWVTFNGNAFDLPILWLRACKYGLSLLRQAIPSDKWGRQSIDLRDRVLATDYRGSTGGLDNVARFFGIETKTGNGSMVFDWFMSGDFDTLREYCVRDVEILRELHQFIDFVDYGNITTESEKDHVVY